MKSGRVQWRHLLLILALVAMAARLLSYPSQDSPRNVGPRARLMEGTYSLSNGFVGVHVELEDGGYSETLFSCTGRSVQYGHYTFENKKLTLIEDGTGKTQSYEVLPDALRPLLAVAEPLPDLIKTRNSEGVQIISPRLRHGPHSAPPAYSSVLVRQGKAIYKRECSLCHGSHGKRTRETTLNPSPTDLTSREAYRHGTAPNEVYRSIKVGFYGTAMPEFGSILSESEIWQLCFYLKSIQESNSPQKARRLLD